MQDSSQVIYTSMYLQGFSVGVLKNPPMGTQKPSYDNTGGVLRTLCKKAPMCIGTICVPHAKTLLRTCRNNFAYP